MLCIVSFLIQPDHILNGRFSQIGELLKLCRPSISPDPDGFGPLSECGYRQIGRSLRASETVCPWIRRRGIDREVAEPTRTVHTYYIEITQRDELQIDLILSNPPRKAVSRTASKPHRARRRLGEGPLTFLVRFIRQSIASSRRLELSRQPVRAVGGVRGTYQTTSSMESPLAGPGPIG
jgi:hypothetical protein